MIKKIIIAVCTIALLGFVVYYTLVSISRIETADLDYNTVYTEHYDEATFDRIKIGMSEQEAIRLLGKPLETLSHEYKHAVLFSEYDVRINDGGTGVSINDTSNSISFLRIDFDSNGNVLKVFNSEFITDSKESELHDGTFNQIISEFGMPKDSFKCLQSDILNYSRIKDGTYSGKRALIHIRRIMLNSNHVVEKIIKIDGNHFDSYIGACTSN